MDDETHPIPQQGAFNRPVPDPTALTDQAIARLERSITAYIDGKFAALKERLDGIDAATALRIEAAKEIPARIDEKVGHLEGLTNEKFASIMTQFAERDTRSERESRDNKFAVDAAFAAQKEAAAKQEDTFTKQIDKSEIATTETIAKLEALTATQDRALSDKIDDIKERILVVEQRFGAALG